MKRFGPTLLLALPFVVALLPEAVDSTRTIDVTVSPDASFPTGGATATVELMPKEVGAIEINCFK